MKVVCCVEYARGILVLLGKGDWENVVSERVFALYENLFFSRKFRFKFFKTFFFASRWRRTSSSLQHVVPKKYPPFFRNLESKFEISKKYLFQVWCSVADKRFALLLRLERVMQSELFDLGQNIFFFEFWLWFFVFEMRFFKTLWRIQKKT